MGIGKSVNIVLPIFERRDASPRVDLVTILGSSVGSQHSGCDHSYSDAIGKVRTRLLYHQLTVMPILLASNPTKLAQKPMLKSGDILIMLRPIC
jgi:hypothetical protein